MELGDGDHLMLVKRFILDYATVTANDLVSPDIQVTLRGRRFPTQSYSTETAQQAAAQNHVRLRTREVAIRIDPDEPDYSWTFGNLRLDMKPDGKR